MATMTRNSAKELELDDYFVIFRRRKMHFIVPTVLILLVSLLIAFILPPVYRSEATIRIERQTIPSDLVETTVTGYVGDRVQTLTQNILTTNRLWEIAEELDLYPDERQPENLQTIVTRMRENIIVEMIDVEINERGRQTMATVAFKVSFEADAPETAQKVVDELAILYLEENQRSRQAQARGVTAFLEEEANRYRNIIMEIEEKLADFKQVNVAQLPELANVNMQLLDRTDNQLKQVEERIRALEKQITYLQAQLAMTEPYTPVHTPEQGGRPLTLTQQLRALQTELSDVRQRYSEEHPDIRLLKNKIAVLQETLRNSGDGETSGAQSGSFTPDNPAYITLQSQLQVARNELNAERVERERLMQRMREYEARLFDTPAVEREYLKITRDYDIALKNYRETREKLERAGLAAQLEDDAIGERFVLAGPASFSDNPVKPNRMAIMLLGFVLACGAGVSSTFIAEYLDHTVRGFRGVVAVLQAPPLAGIPYIEARRDSMPKKRNQLLAVAVITLAVALVLTSIHVYWKPVDYMQVEMEEVGSTPSEDY